MERIITKSFARLMGRGVHRGFITHEELNKSLGKRNLSGVNLEQAFIHIFDEKIALVEKKSDFKVLKKRESSSKEEGKVIDKSDDPIRMYLREMGGVELLSREGEIAIAKRIEAGKDVMLNALLYLKYFCVAFKELIFFLINCFLILFVCGVREDIFSRKNSKTYFFINLSLIVFAISLNFFSNIANYEGLFSASTL